MHPRPVSSQITNPITNQRSSRPQTCPCDVLRPTARSRSTVSTRTSTKILDFLGDIGGFYATVDLFLFMFGQYFSAKFFFTSIANGMFMRKKTKKEMENLQQTKVKLHPHQSQKGLNGKRLKKLGK